MAKLCEQMMKRSMEILEKENVDLNGQTSALADVILKHAPDWRRVLNELQRASVGGVLNVSVNADTNNYDGLFEALKAKDFKKMRTWVANNVDVDTSAIFRHMYDSMYDRIDAGSIPQLVLILADYQYKAAFVADHELNMVACMTEVMAGVEFK
jgi:hypothetical protein